VSLPFADRLAEAVRRCGNPVCVGLDPRYEQLPPASVRSKASNLHDRAAAYQGFCRGVIDVVAPLVPAVKPQLAFFEQLGPPGMEVFHAVVQHARKAGLLVILDGKRNDIGSTAEAYADAYLGAESVWGGDALTVNPFLGADTLLPFISGALERDAGIFVLVKTSNPGSGMIQDRSDGTPVYLRLAFGVEEQTKAALGTCGYGAVGAVVGATYPEQLAELRGVMPHAWILVPGYGSQGGTARDVAPAFDENGLGALVNNSRGIIFAHARKEYAHFAPNRWQDAVAAATRDMIDQLRTETRAGRLPGQSGQGPGAGGP
jgi:orotidine-5'-phosphate decarboxylase